MKKLTLDLRELKVDSFDIPTTDRLRGTVHGADAHTYWDMSCYGSCDPTQCDGCGSASCGATCGGTCQGWTCHQCNETFEPTALAPETCCYNMC